MYINEDIVTLEEILESYYEILIEGEKFNNFKKKRLEKKYAREAKAEQKLRNKYNLYVEKQKRLGRKPKSYEDWIDYMEQRNNENYAEFQRALITYNSFKR